MEFVAASNESVLDWTNYTMVWPSVSFGNVGQLSQDLLINKGLLKQSNKVELVGYIKSKHVVPMVGPPAFNDQNFFCVNLEVYRDPVEKLMYVQQRANFRNGAKHTVLFAKALVNWISKHNLKRIVTLAGVDNAFCRDVEIMKSQTQAYVVSRNLQNELPSSSLVPLNATEEMWQTKLRGAGIASVIDMLFMKVSNVECVTLLRYCSEGDNIPDAVVLASQTLPLLYEQECEEPQQPQKLEFPQSWSCLYGQRSSDFLF